MKNSSYQNHVWCNIVSSTQNLQNGGSLLDLWIPDIDNRRQNNFNYPLTKWIYLTSPQ